MPILRRPAAPSAALPAVLQLAPRLLALPLALLALAVGALPAGVLCFAEAEHVAFELAASDCCHPEEHQGEGSELRAALDGCCGPCVDVPVLDLPTALGPRAWEAAAAAPVLVAVAPATAPRIAPRTDGPIPERRPHGPPASLRALRTIVLTC